MPNDHGLASTLAAGLVVVLTSCNVAVENPAGCSSSSQCPPGTVCNPHLRSCEPEPVDGFKGEFACDVVPAASQDPTSMPGSQIIGSAAGIRSTLSLGAFCYHDTLPQLGVDVLKIQAQSVDGKVISIVVDWDVAVQQQRAEFTVTKFPLYPPAASFFDDGLGSTYGYASGGSIAFYAPPIVGERLTGYLDMTMAGTIEAPAVYSAACPRGAADCGRLYMHAFCSTIEFTNGTTHEMCTTFCDSDADCAPGNGVCVAELCATPCASDDDCIPPYVCVGDGSNRPMGCF